MGITFLPWVLGSETASYVWLMRWQVDSRSWTKHRRITSAALNEQNNGLVWGEAVRQSHDTVRYWASQEEVTSTADDNRTLSLHILSAAGFGKSYPFEPAKSATPNSHAATTYREALQTILDNCLILFIFGTKFIQHPWLPQKLRQLNAAVQSFQASMTQQYETEKQAFAASTPASTNLMTQLILASLGADGLSESEVYGNMFVFNFAGHDTTAHTLTFTIFLLATAHEVQGWVAEELRHVLGSAPPEEWNYATGFPRLKRTLALMLETLRLFPPVPIAKATGMTDSALTVRGRTYVIPANTLLIPNHVAVHTHPKVWGEDSLVFDPRRWITSLDEVTSIDSEVLVTPRKGSFVPWSEGVRNCPGKKFSQVEFVACLATMLKDYHVVPKVFEGESVERMSSHASLADHPIVLTQEHKLSTLHIHPPILPLLLQLQWRLPSWVYFSNGMFDDIWEPNSCAHIQLAFVPIQDISK